MQSSPNFRATLHRPCKPQGDDFVPTFQSVALDFGLKAGSATTHLAPESARWVIRATRTRRCREPRRCRPTRIGRRRRGQDMRRWHRATAGRLGSLPTRPCRTDGRDGLRRVGDDRRDEVGHVATTRLPPRDGREPGDGFRVDGSGRKVDVGRHVDAIGQRDRARFDGRQSRP
jgi:hypothetical protein